MRHLAAILIAVGLVLLGGGVFLLTRDSATSGDLDAVEEALRPATPATVESTPATDTPESGGTDDDPPVAPPSSTVTAAVPRPIGLRIDTLEVAAPVEPYGVDESGQMAVPNNVTEVAWYRFGPKPGEPGSAVLAAHVDLAGSGPGVFFDLDTLEEDDQITVTYEDGSETVFRVVARGVYEKEELPLDVIFSRQGPPVLTLITCGGAFNRNISRYDSNIVVYAVPAGSEDFGSLR